MGNKIMVQASDIKTASGQIDHLIQDYKQNCNKIYSTVNQLKSAWKGADNEAYCAKIEGFKQYFTKLNTLMDQYSAFLKKAAKVYSQTQSEIANAARRL